MSEHYHEEERLDDDLLFEEPGVLVFESLDPEDDTTFFGTGHAPMSSQPTRCRVTVVNRALYRSGRSNEGVTECLLQLTSLTGSDRLSASTNSSGNAATDTSALADGEYQLTAQAQNTSDAQPGPGFPADPLVPRIWRPLETVVTIEAGRIRDAQSDDILIKDNVMTILLQPTWLRSLGTSERRTDPTMIIVHHTGSMNLAGDLRHLIFSKQASADYVVDEAGHVYKLVPDHHYSWHAGYSFWQGREGVNNRSVGIEILHATKREYTQKQIDAVQILIEKLLEFYPSIDRSQVIGHSDVAVTKKENRPPTKHGRKSTDPGSVFPWEIFEALGIGLIPKLDKIQDDIYGNAFQLYPDLKIRTGDNDQTNTYDGKVRYDITADVIHALQEDLQNIGYRCPADGAFGAITHRALQMFQQHMFSGSRKRGSDPWNSGDGEFDRETALMVRGLIAGLTVSIPA